MSIRKMVLAAVMAVFAFAAMPAFAAANVTADLPADSNFTVHGGAGQLTGALNIKCSTTTGSGKFESSTTGKIKFTFHSCSVLFPCTTSGQPSGTITTTELPFHLVTITNKKPGVLITPGANNHFASFSCVVASAVVGGNGVIGEITSPCNVKSKTFGVNFAGSGTVQNHTTIDGSSTEYSLTSSIGGGAPANAALDSSGTATFVSGGEGTLTC